VYCVSAVFIYVAILATVVDAPGRKARYSA